MNSRMNLFRELRNPTLKKKNVNLRLALQTASIHTLIGAGMLSITVLGLFLHLISYYRVVRETKKQVAETRKKMEQLTADSDRMTAEVKVKRNLAAAPSEELLSAENDLDGTWTSLIWKLAAYSGMQVRFQKMVLGSSTAQAGAPSPKQVSIEGQAESVAAMRDWLSALLHHVPGYDFIMDYQGEAGDGAYPITFRVTARVK